MSQTIQRLGPCCDLAIAPGRIRSQPLEPPDPGHVGLLGAAAVVTCSQRLAHIQCGGWLEQAKRSAVLRLIRRGQSVSGPRATRHSISWSACSRTAGGIFNPRAFAVLTLITSSYLFGCSTGSSAGFAPLRILSA